MIDPTSPSASPIDAQAVWQRYLAQEAARNALFETLRPANQATIFEALA